jgi:hypothetical protein
LCWEYKIVAQEAYPKNSFSNPLGELELFQFKRAGDYYLCLLIYMEERTILDLQDVVFGGALGDLYFQVEWEISSFDFTFFHILYYNFDIYLPLSIFL